MNSDLFVFHSADNHYRVEIPQEQIQETLNRCRRAHPKETGGVLVGHYSATGDSAIVTCISRPPRGSRGGRNWFHRAIGGVNLWLAQLWRFRRHHYLGEWHCHPNSLVTPSPKDILTLSKIASDPATCTPEPLLLIIGADSAGNSDFGLFVYKQGRGLIVLRLMRLNASELAEQEGL